MRAEDVWRLPQSLRDGWRRWAERPSASHRDGRVLITGADQRPATSLSFRSSLLFSPSDFRPPSLFSCPSRRLVQDAPSVQRSPPFFSFLLPLLPFLVFLLHTTQGIPVQFWSCRKANSTWRTSLRAMNRITKACWQGRRQGSLEFFLSISV